MPPQPPPYHPPPPPMAPHFMHPATTLTHAFPPAQNLAVMQPGMEEMHRQYFGNPPAHSYQPPAPVAHLQLLEAQQQEEERRRLHDLQILEVQQQQLQQQHEQMQREQQLYLQEMEHQVQLQRQLEQQQHLSQALT
ncbi:hypothetical protein PISMIDRAFT_20122 [Pisolithus microcarpus 441]|uniref:Uncharacterized protein n=1 Tax=Pisolithus microcarpus 441 TaxID=765257 RepID=A0A0C9Y0L6_9AGAM|nr:hypothetical protein PISMIDRAFT_20122 [Pisolithus microcarpus 441]